MKAHIRGAPPNLNLGSRWRCAVSFMPQPLYSQGKCPQYPLGCLFYKTTLWNKWQYKNSGYPLDELHYKVFLYTKLWHMYMNHIISEIPLQGYSVHPSKNET
jgi:hypothetical protein